MRFKEYLLSEDMMGGPSGMPPPGPMAGPPGGMPPPPGGLPPVPPGGGLGGPMGGPGGPMGGAPANPITAQVPVDMKDVDVWTTLDQILNGKEPNKDSKGSPEMLQSPKNNPFLMT